MDSDNSDDDDLISTISQSSTSSLLSILEHDNVHSDDDGSTNSLLENSVTISQNNNEDVSTLTDDITDLTYGTESLDLNYNDNHTNIKQETEIIPSHGMNTNMNISQEQDNRECPFEKLTAWEKWVISKAKEVRKNRVRKLKEKMKKLKHEDEASKLKEEHKKRLEEIFAINLKERNNKKKLAVPVSLEKPTPKVSKEKLDENFKKWCNMKLKKSKERIEIELKNRSEKELAEEKRQKMTKESYDMWLAKNKDRRVNHSRSYVYINGRLREYFDSGASPEASHTNPVPWQF